MQQGNPVGPYAQGAMLAPADITEDAACPVVGIDTGGVIRSWNRGAQSLFGRTKAEAVGQHISVITLPDERARWEGELRSLLVNDAACTYEAQGVVKDGAVLRLLVTLSPTRDADGRIVGASSVMQDISALRTAIEEGEAERGRLQGRLSELETILDAVPLGVVQAHDRGGTVITGNPAANALFELSSNANLSTAGPDAQGLPYRLYRDGKEVKPEERLLQRCASQGIPYFNTEQQFHFRDGRIKHVLSSGVPLFDAQGAPRGAVAFFMDTTEQHRKDVALEEAVEDLNTILDVVPVGVILTRDPEGKAVHGNASANALYEVPAGTNISQTGAAAGALPYELTKDGGRLAVSELPFRRALLGHPTQDFEMEVRFKNGAVKHIITSSVPLTDRQGAVRGAVSSLYDVTELRAKERELEAVAMELRTVLDILPVGVAVSHDPASQVVTGNRFFDETFQIPGAPGLAGDLVSVPLPLRFFQGDQELAVEDLPLQRAAREGARAEARELEVRFPDGKSVLITVNAVPFLDGSGMPQGAVASILNVTELRAKERELERTVTQLRTILDLVPTGIVVLQDVEGRNVIRNRAMVELLGQPQGVRPLEVQSVDPLPFEPYGEDGKKLSYRDLPAQRAARTGKPLEAQPLEFRLADGTVRHVLNSARPLVDSDGTVIGAVSSVTDVTVLRAKERELERTIAQLRTILDVVPTGVTVLDKGHPEMATRNRAMLEILGLPAEDAPMVHQPIEPRTYVPYRNGERIDPSELAGQRALWTGAHIVDEELELRLQDGSVKHVLNSASPLLDAQGEVIGSVSSITDVTVLRTKERDLERAALQIQTILGLVPTGVTVLYADNPNIVTRNRAMLEMLGLHSGDAPMSEQPIAPHPYELYKNGERVSPEDLPGRRALRSGMPIPAEHLEYRLFDGTVKHVLNSAHPLVDSDGRLFGAVASVTDVTVLRAKEQELEHTITQLRTILDLIPTGIVIFHTADGRVATRNRALKEVLGLPSSDPPLTTQVVDEMPFEAFKDGTRIPRSQMPADRAMEEGVPVLDEEIEVRTRNGRDLRFLISAVPLTEGDGRVSGAVAAMTDVTTLRTKERELAEALRHRDMFMRMLGHELRNPMAVISAAVGSVEIMAEEMGITPVVSSLSVAQREIDHLTRLLDDMLDIARITRGQLEIKREPVNLAAIAREAVEENEIARKDYGPRTVLNVESDGHWVEGDSQRLAQVLRNILTNSRKFTPVGGLITVILKRGDGDNAEIVLEDTGIGMGPDELSHLFEAFWQSPTSGNRSGLGLGLAISKEIVERHGGAIRAESEGRGMGLRTTISLPLAKHVAAAVSPPGAGKAAAMPSRRVLLIEDDPLVSEAMEILLGFLGQTVQVAHNGPDAIEAARLFKPDIVLCDLGLPGDMDGYAVARILATDSTIRPARLVALSGYAGHEERVRSKEAGFDVHLAKPVGVQNLRKLLAEALV